MQLKSHVRLMAEYNRWMNQKIFEACASLSPEQLGENKGAFFGSIIGTLNHIAVADTVWLQRFAAALDMPPELEAIVDLPQPSSLNEILFPQLNSLKVRREFLDEVFLTFAAAVTDDELVRPIAYKNFRGVASTRLLFGLLMHVFNHQTHHRGQVTTLLSQSSIDIGVTDLVAIIPALPE